MKKRVFPRKEFPSYYDNNMAGLESVSSFFEDEFENINNSCQGLKRVVALLLWNGSSCSCVSSTVPHAAYFDSAGGCEALSVGSVTVERQWRIQGRRAKETVEEWKNTRLYSWWESAQQEESHKSYQTLTHAHTHTHARAHTYTHTHTHTPS